LAALSAKGDPLEAIDRLVPWESFRADIDGYKNHVNADAKHKLIRRYDVSDAAVHDSQKLDGLLHTGNTSDAVLATALIEARAIAESW
jgi:hypothetical protein